MKSQERQSPQVLESPQNEELIMELDQEKTGLQSPVDNGEQEYLQPVNFLEKINNRLLDQRKSSVPNIAPMLNQSEQQLQYQKSQFNNNEVYNFPKIGHVDNLYDSQRKIIRIDPNSKQPLVLMSVSLGQNKDFKRQDQSSLNNNISTALDYESNVIKKKVDQKKALNTVFQQISRNDLITIIKDKIINNDPRCYAIHNYQKNLKNMNKCLQIQQLNSNSNQSIMKDSSAILPPQSPDPFRQTTHANTSPQTKQLGFKSLFSKELSSLQIEFPKLIQQRQNIKKEQQQQKIMKNYTESKKKKFNELRSLLNDSLQSVQSSCQIDENSKIRDYLSIDNRKSNDLLEESKNKNIIQINQINSKISESQKISPLVQKVKQHNATFRNLVLQKIFNDKKPQQMSLNEQDLQAHQSMANNNKKKFNSIQYDMLPIQHNANKQTSDMMLSSQKKLNFQDYIDQMIVEERFQTRFREQTMITSSYHHSKEQRKGLRIIDKALRNKSVSKREPINNTQALSPPIREVNQQKLTQSERKGDGGVLRNHKNKFREYERLKQNIVINNISTDGQE